MGQEASVPQRIGDDLSSSQHNIGSSSLSAKGANTIRGANDAAVAAANNAATTVFVGQSLSSSSQPQSQHMIGGGSSIAMMQQNTNHQQQPTGSGGSSASSSSLMSRSGISSMIQSAKRLSVRTNAGGGGDDNTANNYTHTDMMNGGTAAIMPPPQHSPLHQYYHSESVHHGELSPKSQAIMMQQQQQRQMGIVKQKNKSQAPQPQKQQQLSQQQLIQQQYYQQQHLTTPFSSAQSTPYHTPQGTPQGSVNTVYNVMYNNATHGGDGRMNSSGSASDAQTVHTTNVTTTAPTTTSHHHHQSLSLTSNSNHGPKIINRGLSPPSSPRALALSKMKDNDEDDWAKAWAEDSGDSDDEEEEEEREEGAGGVEGGHDNKVIIGGGDGQHPPSMPMLSVQGNAMMGQQQQQQQQQQQLHQPQQQYLQQQSTPSPYLTPGQSQPKGGGVLPNDRIIQQDHNSLFTSPQPQLQQQQQQLQYQPQHHTILEEEDAKLLLQADQALQKDGGSWDPYSADNDVEKPCVEMFDPALRVLGRGSFGRVVLVQKQYGEGQGSLYAMKILRKSHLVRRRQIERTKTERKVLARLDHPFLMKLHYAFQNTEKLFLVLDYCPGGELFFHLSRYRRFQEPVARFYAAELMLAIGHLHKHGVIYRDLKPENVLLDAYGHVKLGDFGLAKDGIRHPTQGAKSTCGTPEYMAPEVLNQQGHGFCVDYWGLGMILFEMMTGLPPWYTTDRAKLFRRLRSAPLIFPNEITFSPACKTCIAGLLERDPRLRIGVLGLRSAMKHEFFHRKINFEALRSRQISAPIRPCEGWRQFQSKSNSVENESKGWHSASPSLESAAMGNITAEALDVATANFDDSFRRMPIETEDFEKQQQAQGHPPISEKDLNAQTFRGFTFDGDISGDIPPPEESLNSPNDLRGELT